MRDCDDTSRQASWEVRRKERVRRAMDEKGGEECAVAETVWRLFIWPVMGEECAVAEMEIIYLAPVMGDCLPSLRFDFDFENCIICV